MLNPNLLLPLPSWQHISAHVGVFILDNDYLTPHTEPCSLGFVTSHFNLVYFPTYVCSREHSMNYGFHRQLNMESTRLNKCQQISSLTS